MRLTRYTAVLTLLETVIIASGKCFFDVEKVRNTTALRMKIFAIAASRQQIPCGIQIYKPSNCLQLSSFKFSSEIDS
jgi:hypothetical protein